MARIGETKCCNPACTCADAAVHRTAGGKLSVRCHKCGTERWAPVGTRAHRDLLEQTALDEVAPAAGADAPPAAPPAANPAPAPKTKPARTASAFSLGNL